MATIYEMTKEQKEILSELYWLDEEGEDFETQKTRLERRVAELAFDAERKVDFLLTLYFEARAVADAQKEAEMRMAKRRKATETRRDWLKAFMLQTMQTFDIKKVIGKDGNVARYLGPESLIVDANVELTKDFLTHVPERWEPNKALIKEALKSGEIINGCELIRRETVRVS